MTLEVNKLTRTNNQHPFLESASSRRIGSLFPPLVSFVFCSSQRQKENVAFTPKLLGHSYLCDRHRRHLTLLPSLYVGERGGKVIRLELRIESAAGMRICPTLRRPLLTPIGAGDEEGERCLEFRVTSVQECPSWSRKEGEMEMESERV